MTTFIKVSSFGEELYINTANIAFFKEYDDKRVEVTSCRMQNQFILTLLYWM